MSRWKDARIQRPVPFMFVRIARKGESGQWILETGRCDRGGWWRPDFTKIVGVVYWRFFEEIEYNWNCKSK